MIKLSLREEHFLRSDLSAQSRHQRRDPGGADELPESSTHSWSASTLLLLWLLVRFATTKASHVKSEAKLLFRGLLTRAVPVPSRLVVPLQPENYDVGGELCLPPPSWEPSIVAELDGDQIFMEPLLPKSRALQRAFKRRDP